MNPAIARLAEAARRRRARPSAIGIKINLYNAVETTAVLGAIAAVGAADDVECIMVGDSYLMTHLGRASTRLEDRTEQVWFLRILESLVADVAAVLRGLPAERRPLLVGDMPDGSTDSPASALAVAERLAGAGADIVKLEIASPRVLAVLAALVREGHAVLAHVGYTPQAGTSRRHGDSLEEALALFKQARAIRDLGACGLVLELVCEQVNRALSAGRGALPTYSIFSGRAPGGGQSLNVWDSVFVPDQPRRYFPPTASMPRAAYPDGYTAELIENRMASLLDLTLRGEFPLSPPTRLSPRELELLAVVDPWAEPGACIAMGTGA